MQGIEFLNTKKIKLIYEFLSSQYGLTEKLPYAFLLRLRDNRLSIVNRETTQIDFEKLRVNSMGNYFGEWNTDNTQVRLSIEGSQIVGKLATKNILTLSNQHFAQWLKGEDLQVSEVDITDQSGYVLIQNELGDFCGCGRIKDATVLNFVPKVRRVSVVVGE